MKTTAEITIGKPIDRVWEFVSNIENLALWVEGIEAPEQTPDGPIGAGTTDHRKYNYRGKSFDMDHEIYEFEPPNRLDTRSTEGPFPYDVTMVLAEADGGTSVSIHGGGRLRQLDDERHLRRRRAAGTQGDAGAAHEGAQSPGRGACRRLGVSRAV